MINHAVGDFCHLLKAFTNSLDQDQAQRWDLSGSKLFDTLHYRIPERSFLKKLILKKSQVSTEALKIHSMQMVNGFNCPYSTQTTNPPKYQESINVRIRLGLWRIVFLFSTHYVMFYVAWLSGPEFKVN